MLGEEKAPGDDSQWGTLVAPSYSMRPPLGKYVRRGGDGGDVHAPVNTHAGMGAQAYALAHAGFIPAIPRPSSAHTDPGPGMPAGVANTQCRRCREKTTG